MGKQRGSHPKKQKLTLEQRKRLEDFQRAMRRSPVWAYKRLKKSKLLRARSREYG